MCNTFDFLFTGCPPKVSPKCSNQRSNFTMSTTLNFKMNFYMGFSMELAEYPGYESVKSKSATRSIWIS